MLRIMTWFWSQPGGRTTYTASHVNIWAAMMRRNLTIPHELCCVTDMPEGIDPSVTIIPMPKDFVDVSIPTWGGGFPQCLRRIALFSPDAEKIFGAKRFVSMDLDCVVWGNIDHLFNHDRDFTMYKGTSGRRPYNGSMLQMDAGARPSVYNDFTVEEAVKAGEMFIGSDQAWISYKLGWGEATWSEPDGVYWFNSRYRPAMKKGEVKLLFFPGKMKPWTAAKLDGRMNRHYRL
jgi:hypothetical protein